MLSVCVILLFVFYGKTHVPLLKIFYRHDGIENSSFKMCRFDTICRFFTEILKIKMTNFFINGNGINNAHLSLCPTNN